MPPVYQVYMFQHLSKHAQQGHGYAFLNLDEEALSERVVANWDRGLNITWDGKTRLSRSS